MKKSSTLLIFLIIALLLCSCLLGILIHHVASYNLGKAEKDTATVVAKTAEKGLFQPPKHYIKVDRNKESDDPFDGLLNRVSSIQAKDLEIGEDISGFMMRDHRFLTHYDLLIDNLWMIGIIGTVIFIILGIILSGIIIISSKRKKKKQSKAKRPVKEKMSFPFGKVFLIMFLIVGGILTSTFVVNGFHKLFPFGQIEAKAVIVDKHSEREIYLHRFDGALMGDPLFQFELNYPDENGEVHQVIKEVTHHTYSSYERADTIPISYRKSNVFDVFIRDTSLTDAFDIYVYWEFNIYMMIIAIGILLVIFALRNRFKEKVK